MIIALLCLALFICALIMPAWLLMWTVILCAAVMLVLFVTYLSL